MKKFLPTQPAKPVPGWPLTITDILKERIEKEDQMAHRFIINEFPEDVMKKEVTSLPKTAVMRNGWLSSVRRSWIFIRP